MATVRLPGGPTLNYREWGRPDGAVVLLLHGLTSSSQSWRNVAPPCDLDSMSTSSHLGGVNEGRILASFLRIGVASAAMGAAALAADVWLAGLLPGDAIGIQIVRVVATIGFAVMVLAGAAWALRIREFHEAMDVVLRRFR